MEKLIKVHKVPKKPWAYCEGCGKKAKTRLQIAGQWTHAPFWFCDECLAQLKQEIQEV